MATPNSTIIKKLTNGNVEVTEEGGVFTLLPNSYLVKQSDGVIVRGSDNRVLADFKVATVEKVVKSDLTDIAINDVNTLFTQLSTNFFFFSDDFKEIKLRADVISSVLTTSIIKDTFNNLTIVRDSNGYIRIEKTGGFVKSKTFIQVTPGYEIAEDEEVGGYIWTDNKAWVWGGKANIASDAPFQNVSIYIIEYN